ncbi:MAG: cytochrome P450 [Cyanobacteria bacterium P01_H01_bin.15]
MSTLPVVETPNFIQFFHWVLNPTDFMETYYKKYGDIFATEGLWSAGAPLLMLSEPDAIKQMLSRDSGRVFSAPGEINEILEPLLGRQNLMLLSGQAHRNRRRLVLPHFHGGRIQLYGQIIQQITQAVVDHWSDQQIRDTRPMMQTITMRVILQAVFGLYGGERYERLEKLLAQRLDITNSPLASMLLFIPWLQQDFGEWSPGARLSKLAKETDDLLFSVIRERRDELNTDRQDILSLLLAATDEEGKGLSDQEVRDELMGLLVAGHETTATALTWALYWIHSVPAVKAKLMDELSAIANPNDPAEIMKCPYLEAVCCETLRIHPVAMLLFPRRVEVPVELSGYALEQGTLVMGSIYLVHQREDLYPNPKQFRPERFLERQFSSFEFMPFGGGARRCVGSALAMYELKIVLGTLLTQLDLSLENKLPVKPRRRGVTLGQDQSVLLKKVQTITPQRSLVEV